MAKDTVPQNDVLQAQVQGESSTVGTGIGCQQEARQANLFGYYHNKGTGATMMRYISLEPTGYPRNGLLTDHGKCNRHEYSIDEIHIMEKRTRRARWRTVVLNISILFGRPISLGKRYLAIVLVNVTLFLQDTSHDLNLKVLPVDNLAGNCIHEALGSFQCQIITRYIGRTKQELGHVDGILMMRNHLVNEQGHVTVGRDSSRHALKHVTIHGVNAFSKLPQVGIVAVLLVTHKRARAELVGQGEAVQAKGSALLVKVARFVVGISKCRFVLCLNLGVIPQELDAARHVFMDLWETTQQRRQYERV